jgi:hypothetical protein
MPSKRDEYLRSSDFPNPLGLKRAFFGFYSEPVLCTLLFLYLKVLCLELGLVDLVHAKPSQHVQTGLNCGEVQAVIHETSAIHLMMAHLLYGSGMRLME